MDTKKKGTVLLAAVGGFCAVVGLAAAFGAFRYTTVDSRYCASCHGDMETLVARSHAHPPGLAACVDCHADAECGTVTGAFAANQATLNARCESCHADIPDLVEPKKQLIKLSHKIHIKEQGGVCTDCHRNVAHDRFPEGTNRPTKETCYACHEHKVEIDGEVNEKNCLRCHFILLDAPREAGRGEKEPADDD